MTARFKDNKFWTGIPPWVLLGAVAVLLPIFAFMTVQNIHREKEFTTRLLLEKGAALIRSFEAGTRTGMMGMQRGGFQLQRLLTETAQVPDIAHLIVTDGGGNVIAHSDLDRVGSTYGEGVDVAAASQSKKLEWRVVKGADGGQVFEVFRKFEPAGPPMGMMRGQMMRRLPEGFEFPADPPRVIFVGLDMTSIDEARRSDVWHAVLMGSILLLAGCAGVTLLLLAQSYRAARTSLFRITAFSDHVVENMPIGLVATDSAERIAAFNQVAESVLSLSAAAVQGKPAETVLPPSLWAQLRESAATRTVIEKEVDCVLADGTVIPLEIGAGRLTDEAGRYQGRILLFKDLREIRTLRSEIARNQRLATVGRLAAGVAHEIRNPLSSIKGFATYFQERYRENAQDAKVASILIQEVDRLNRVVSQLLEFSRPISVLPRPVRLSRLIGDAVKLIEPQAREKAVTVQTDLPAGAEEVRLDPDRLSQVLLNLLLNALEAMAPGGLLTVSAGETADGRRLAIRVSDTGGGIRPEDLSHVFEPYFTTKPSGTGLGLAIAHNIVEALGGDIGVVSRPGAGTTFTLRLPLVKTE
ncbi:MAG: ATP-binding protein [Desulfobacterales bacterium]|jgi:two-component system sensor histidine kinase HydH|nr:ATP-binding protein [Desulfobacterales bacterium]